MTYVFVITVFEILDASGDSYVVQSTCTTLLLQSQVLQNQVAKERGLVEQSRSVRLFSLLFLEEIKS